MIAATVDPRLAEGFDPELADWFFSLSSQERDAFMADVTDKLGEVESKVDERFPPYRFDPTGYIKRYLGWEPWAGQQQVIDAYVLALRQQFERDAFEKGEIPLDDLEYWQPGTVIQNRIRIESGHTIGKTKMLGGLVSHFFDCFAPSITYCFAPGYDQINDLLFKEIRVDRENKGLPGRVLESPDIRHKGNHFVKGKATNDNKGRGTERVHGQHHKYQCFVLDEAEGIPDFVWNAVDSMTSGGISIVLMAANPRTRTSRFFKAKSEPNVKSFRISCLDHPNVLEDKEIVPGAVRRDYVVDMLKHCEEVEQHDPDSHTFELPWQPGVIYKPGVEYLFRVLGIAPANLSDNTFIPVGRYEAATKRAAPLVDDMHPQHAFIGVDCARYGNDNGTIYIFWQGTAKRICEISKQDGYEYYVKVKEECKRLRELGVSAIHIRVDGGGGYGSTCIDNLRRDIDLRNLFIEFNVIEVHFNGTPHTHKDYYDMATELYYSAGERLKVIKVINPPQNLEVDLTERTYEHVLKDGKDVKKLTSKERFKDKFNRSPDDGDGFCLAVAPPFLFGAVGGKVDPDATRAEEGGTWNRSGQAAGRWGTPGKSKAGGRWKR